MKIAVASQNGKTISGHVGRITGFTIFTLDEERNFTSDRIKLEKDQTFHSLHHNLPPALHDIDMLITGGHGPSLVQRLNAIGLRNVITTEKNPEKAIELLIEGKLPVISSEEFHKHMGGHHHHH